MRIVPVRVILAAILIGLGACGEAVPDPSAPTGSERSDPAEDRIEGPNLVFLGDSITAGLHLEGGLDEAFPAILARQAAERGFPFRAINAGLSGDTSAGGLRRLDWVMKSDPRIVVVELGGNDALRGQPIAEIRKNLTAIVTEVLDREVEVMLLGMLLPPSYGPDYVRGFEAIFEELGRMEGVTLVPEFMRDVGGVPELNYRDGLHPNAAGHRLLAEKLLDPVLERLRGMKTRSAGKIDPAVDSKPRNEDRLGRNPNDDENR